MNKVNKIIATIKVLDVVDKPDGSAEIIFDLTQEIKQTLKKELGWKRWSNKKFNELVITGLNAYIHHIESEKNNGH
jgi:hypothetical protein